MQADELPIAVGWASNEGWNPGWHDAECYFKADPNGFFIGYLNDQPIATLSAVRYNDTFGFIGYYIVHPDYRGKGYGLQIWKAGMQYLKGCTIGLDGVVEQQDNYRSFGFQLAYRNHRFEGSSQDTKKLSVEHESSILPLSQINQQAVEEYAARFFPAQRLAFDQAWLTQADALSLGIVEQECVQGVGVIRKVQQGFKIGPLWAETPEYAESLMRALMKWAGSHQLIYLDVAEKSTNGLALAKEHNMRSVFETARMYTAPVESLPFEQLYGVTSFEIG